MSLTVNIIGPHRLHPVHAGDCYRRSSVVCRSVGLPLGHVREPCKNGRTDRDAVWGADSGGSKEPCIRWGRDPPTGRGSFGGCPALSKAYWVHRGKKTITASAAIYAAKWILVAPVQRITADSDSNTARHINVRTKRWRVASLLHRSHLSVDY